MYAVSPLRYPGAKWRLEQFVASLLKDNNLDGGHYAEAYAGGASLALSLLYAGHVSEIHLNDLDRSVYAFWKSALDHSNEFIERVRNTPVALDTWFAQQEIQLQKDRVQLMDLGFSTFFLNRTNRSGILSGGVIGGKSQNGFWKINARFNKTNLVERLKRLASYRSRIHVTRMDALTFLRRRNASLPKKSFIYLDPPYFEKGQDLYLNAYGPEDHAVVARTVLLELNRPWMVSYDDVPQIRSLYRSTRATHYELRYSASLRRKGREVIFLAPRLRIRSGLLRNA